MFEDCIAVGHAGEVVAHSPWPSVASGAFASHGPDFGMVPAIIVEKVLENFSGANVRFVYDRIVIKIPIEEGAQLEIELAASAAVLDDCSGLEPDFVGTGNAGAADEFFSGSNNILDLEVDDPTNDKVSAAFIRKFTILALDSAAGFAPDAHMAIELGLRKKSRLEAVIEIMAVVCDLVSEIGHLGFEGG